MKIPVIYKCVNKITGVVVYVGHSIDQIGRLNGHHRLLLQGKHRNKKLQAGYLKHGSGAFVWTRLEVCPSESLCGREKHWIRVLAPTCNKAAPPKAIRRDNPRFNPTVQEIRRQARKRLRTQRSTHT